MTRQIIGIIPARYHSTRFPAKMLAPLAGKTLIQHTYENALASSVFTRLIIATDDERIANHTEQFGAETMLTSVSCPTGTDRLMEVLHQDHSLKSAHLLVNIQGDEPLIHPATFQALIDQMGPETTMGTIATPLKNPSDPSVVKVVLNQAGQALYFSRAPIPGRHPTTKMQAHYLRHLGLYAFTPDFLTQYASWPATPLQQIEGLEQLKVLEMGHPIEVAVVEEEGIGVDTPEELQLVEERLCQLNSSL